VICELPGVADGLVGALGEAVITALLGLPPLIATTPQPEFVPSTV
jgi:hypothetical protein